ncbi:MAG TPA: TRAP transporter small permease [Spirochaetia bacterium]|nr:TRAP transporter small permease [Spirochaetia bacterium]
MKSLPRRIFDFLEVYLPAAIFSVLILSVFVQVVFRYIFDQPIPQLFEISIYSFIWVIYLGGALATRYDQHMRFDLIYRKLSRNGRYVVDMFFDTLLNVIISVIIYPTIATVVQMYKLKSDTLGIPWSYLLVCFPIFLILIFIHNTISIVLKIREMAGAEKPAEETPPWL